MNLDRGLIKAQAKELIKGKVMKLFLTVFIIQCIALVPNIISAVVAEPQYQNFFENYGSYFDDFDFDDEFNDYRFENDDDYNPYADDFENFGTDNNSGKSDFYNFGTNFVPTNAKTEIAPQKSALNTVTSQAISYLIIIVQILLMPLAITLLYYFVLFIRGKEFSGIDGLKFIFKETFTNNYGKKIGVYLLRELISVGLVFICMVPILILSALIIAPIIASSAMTGSDDAMIIAVIVVMFIVMIALMIPAIIFHYSSYFAFEIMCDNPHLSAWQAIKLSKKMIKGNRTELFVLDLSFIPWALLCVFLFPLIYVIPYVQTTRALYYENFRIRALQQGRVSEDDFLTDYQRMQKYAAQNNGAYQQGANGYQPNAYQQNPYNPQQPNAQQNTYQPNGTPYQQNTTYQQVNTEQSGTCNASHVQSPPFYTVPPTPTADSVGFGVPDEPQSNPAPTVDSVGFGVSDEPSVGVDDHIEPQPTTDPAETAEPEPQPEQLKPSEKYTPVTPPTENYTPTEE